MFGLLKILSKRGEERGGKRFKLMFLFWVDFVKKGLILFVEFFFFYFPLFIFFFFLYFFFFCFFLSSCFIGFFSFGLWTQTFSFPFFVKKELFLLLHVRIAGENNINFITGKGLFGDR